MDKVIIDLWKKLPAPLRNRYFLTAVVFIAFMVFFDRHDVLTQIHLQRTVNKLEHDKVFYEEQIENYTIVTGTPDTVIPKIRHILEELRPGSVFFWDGDGALTHDDQMRSLRLMGQEVIPAVREIAKELDLPSSFDINPATGAPFEDTPAIAEVAD